MTLQARPTTYRGVKMRSRLEARYAAVLDADDEPWEYEPRAFGGRRGQYLPDFVIRHRTLTFYIEVKPTVELALRVMERMTIILESEPDAWLEIHVPGAGGWMSRPRRRKWRFFPDRVGRFPA